MQPQLRLHHLGYATSDINKSLSFFRRLGYEPELGFFKDDFRGIEIQFVKIPGSDILIEMISPGVNKTENNELIISLNRMIKARPGLYHLGYELQSSEFIPKNFGLRKISDKAPAIALNNREVEFYVQHDGSIVEIIYPMAQF